MQRLKLHRVILCILSLCLSLAPTFAKPGGGGGGGSVGVAPPQSKPHGRSYGEWSALHW